MRHKSKERVEDAQVPGDWFGVVASQGALGPIKELDGAAPDEQQMESESLASQIC